jgi:hypothetical protein
VVLAICALPGGLAGHAAGRVWKRSDALVPDLATAILTDAKATVGSPIARMIGLLAISLENFPDALAVRALALNLREIGFPEALAHEDSVSTAASV